MGCYGTRAEKYSFDCPISSGALKFVVQVRGRRKKKCENSVHARKSVQEKSKVVSLSGTLKPSLQVQQKEPEMQGEAL